MPSSFDKSIECLEQISIADFSLVLFRRLDLMSQRVEVNIYVTHC